MKMLLKLWLIYIGIIPEFTIHSFPVEFVQALTVMLSGGSFTTLVA